MNKKIIIPEDYSELTKKQLRIVVRGFLKMTITLHIQPVDVQRDLADYILGRKKYIYSLKREKYFLMVDRVAGKLDWLFCYEGNLAMMNFNTTENILPVLNGLQGPQSHGADITFCEFRTAVDIMEQYNQDHDDETLDALVGTLYRLPDKKETDPDFNGQYRRKFNKHHIGIYTRRAKKIQPEFKYAIYLWFANFCRYLVEGVFYIEGKEVEFAPVFGVNEDPDTKSNSDKLGMMSILFTLADAGTFGNVEATDNALLLDVMCKLLNDHNLAKQLQKK
ncbi:MAG: hypothetical protein VB046_09760 [Paludibacter sp.]|nr:hypothetical protein [Paludibacter sp.]